MPPYNSTPEIEAYLKKENEESRKRAEDGYVKAGLRDAEEYEKLKKEGKLLDGDKGIVYPSNDCIVDDY